MIWQKLNVKCKLFKNVTFIIIFAFAKFQFSIYLSNLRNTWDIFVYISLQICRSILFFVTSFIHEWIILFILLSMFRRPKLHILTFQYFTSWSFEFLKDSKEKFIVIIRLILQIRQVNGNIHDEYLCI